MAVVPALTFPSKCILSIPTDAARIMILYPSKKMRSIYPTLQPVVVHFIAPLLLYRSVALEQTYDFEPGFRAMIYLPRKRVAQYQMSVSRMKGFPLPYFSRGTTRPVNGEQWPRFAVFGSTV